MAATTVWAGLRDEGGGAGGAARSTPGLRAALGLPGRGGAWPRRRVEPEAAAGMVSGRGGEGRGAGGGGGAGARPGAAGWR